MRTPRVVSLIPSATEIVCALGAETALVGRSHECDFPAAVSRLPACCEPRFDINGDSREIDERVRETLSESTAVYRVFTERLAELRPSLIVTQAQCDVCAVSLGEVEAAVQNWDGPAPQVVTLAPASVHDIWKDILTVGQALGRQDAARQLISELQQRLNQLQQVVADQRPRVFCLEWIEPPMAAGNWVPELLSWLGAVDVLGQPRVHSEFLEWDAVQTADPDRIVVMPCGFDLERTARELESLRGLSAWNTLSAVRRGEVYVTDGNQYFNRPGPRIVDSAEILAEILSDGRLTFGHAGRGWRRWRGSDRTKKTS